MTIDDMKAELEANGYRSRNDYPVHKWNAPDGVTTFTSGWVGTIPVKNNKIATEYAYRHLQERRELEALRGYVLKASGSHATFRKDIEGYYDELVGEAQELITRFTITTDDESDEL